MPFAHVNAGKRCAHALVRCSLAACVLLSCGFAAAASLAEKARESGCASNSKPTSVEGSMYRCKTESGDYSYFNIPGAGVEPRGVETLPRAKAAAAPSPSGFPKVDSGTQRSRDDLRRKVLGDELAAEDKLLADARLAYANGAPAPLPEEQNNAERYRDRLVRLRQAVQLHERNVDALKKELGNIK
jgi:hypothetical protein